MEKKLNPLDKLRRLKRVTKHYTYRMARNLKVVSPKDASKEATKDASYGKVTIREPNTSHSLTDGYIPELDLEDTQRKIEDTQRKIEDTLEKVRLTLEDTPEHAPEVVLIEDTPEYASEVAQESEMEGKLKKARTTLELRREETPTEEAPTEEAPKETTKDTPEEAPTEEAPTEEAPTEEAPKETTKDTPEEAPTEEAPTEEAPTEEAPTEEAPTEEAPKDTPEHAPEVAQESEIKDKFEKSRTTLELRSKETPSKKRRKTKKEKELEEEEKLKKELEEEEKLKKELEEEEKELFRKKIKAGLVDVDENILMSQANGKYYMVKTSWHEYYYPDLAREISKTAFDTFATKHNNLNEYESLDGAINIIKKDRKYEVQIDYDTYIINSKKEADRIIKKIKKSPEDSSIAIDYVRNKFSPTTASNLDKAYRVTLKRNPVNTSVIGSGVVGGGIYGGIKLFGGKDKDLDDEKPKTSFDSDGLNNNQQDSSDKKDAIEELMKNLNLDSENNDTIKF